MSSQIYPEPAGDSAGEAPPPPPPGYVPPHAATPGIALPGQAFMGKTYTQAPFGVSENAKLNSIEPGTCFQHDLLPGETVLKTYDVHMPNILITKWQLYLYSCLTLGIFYVWWMCYTWCLRKGWCTLPNISMTRGMMAVTSTGRVLVWKTQFNQARTGKNPICCKICCGEKCNDPIDWTSATLTRTYQLKNIHDIALKLHVQRGILCGICCCTELYESSVRVRFGEFPMEKAAWTDAFQTMPSDMYKAMVSNSFSSAGIDLFALAFDLVQAFLPKPLDLDWVDIVSERQDEMTKDLENPDFKDSYAGLSDIARSITELIVGTRSAVWLPPKDRTNLMNPHQAQVSGHEDFATMDLVKDETCAAPPAYVPLAPGEEIIATTAEIYFVTFMDKLKIFLCVLGILYLMLWLPVMFMVPPFFLLFWKPVLRLVEIILEIRAKRQSRNGYILTTHRIIYVSVWRKDTILSVCLPSFLLCCFPTQEETIVRSIFPKKVESGVFKRLERDLMGVYLTNAGAISLHFSLPNVSAADYNQAESRISKRLAFLKAMANVVSRSKTLDASTVSTSAELQVFGSVLVFILYVAGSGSSRILADRACVCNCRTHWRKWPCRGWMVRRFLRGTPVKSTKTAAPRPAIRPRAKAAAPIGARGTLHAASI